MLTTLEFTPPNTNRAGPGGSFSGSKGLTQADICCLGKGGYCLVWAKAILLPQSVSLLQGQDDSHSLVPLPLAFFFNAVVQFSRFLPVPFHHP